MNSPRYLPPRTRRSRRGLSFVEFVGCILALGSGVAIGSLYLGVDMKTLFVGILEKAELVDPGFFGGKAVAQEVTRSREAAQPASSLAQATLSSSPAPVESIESITSEKLVASSSEPTKTMEPAGKSSTDTVTAEQLAATLAYWQGLSACIKAEKAHRSTSSRDVENWQLFDYLTLRREGHQQAIAAIEQLDESNVDDRLLWHGRQVLSWHQAGAKLFGRAVDLLTDAPTDRLTGPFAQSWQSSATQHRMEENLVREKHLSVAGYLDHTYKDRAPFQPAF